METDHQGVLIRRGHVKGPAGQAHFAPADDMGTPVRTHLDEL